MKCKFKSILALAIALVMCVTMLPAAFAADTDRTPDPNGWDGTTTAAIPHEGNTYTISTPEQLARLAVDVNKGTNYSGKTVVLANDINLNYRSFTPIGTWNGLLSRRGFKGVFDGNNHTIRNANISGHGTNSNGIIRAGLFGYVHEGRVENLVLEDIVVINDSTSNSGNSLQNYKESATGIAVATLESGTISNVSTTTNCSVEGHLRTGGIVGDIRKSSLVTGCNNNAKVTGKNMYTGGIVGAAHDVSANLSDMGSTIQNCNNYAEVDAQNQTNVGGIVGYADRTTVSNCENAGKITGTGNYGTGGIMGCCALNNNYTTPGNDPKACVIDTCKNKGVVVGGRAGGIMGAFVLAPSCDAPTEYTVVCKIISCDNSGAISGTNGVCGAIYGKTITYKTGADPDTMVVSLEGTNTNTGTVCGANPGDNFGPFTAPTNS